MKAEDETEEEGEWVMGVRLSPELRRRADRYKAISGSSPAMLARTVFAAALDLFEKQKGRLKLPIEVVEKEVAWDDPSLFPSKKRKSSK